MSLAIDAQTVGGQLQQASGAFGLIEAYCVACRQINIQVSYPNIQLTYSLKDVDPVFAANLTTAQAHASQWTDTLYGTLKSEVFDVFPEYDLFKVGPIWDSLLQLEQSIRSNGGTATSDQFQQVNDNLADLQDSMNQIGNGISTAFSQLKDFNALLVQDQQNLVSGENSVYQAKIKVNSVINQEIQANAGLGDIEQTWADIGEDWDDSLDKLAAEISSLGNANVIAQEAISEIQTQWQGFQNLINFAVGDLQSASQSDAGSHIQALEISTSKNEWDDLVKMAEQADSLPPGTGVRRARA